MKYPKISILTILLLSFALIGQAQDQEPNAEGSLDEGTIKSQYDYVWSSSNKYQNNKVVKMFKLNKLMDNVQDTLKLLHAKIGQLNSNGASAAAEKTQLTNEIDTLNTQLNLAIEEKDSFAFMGTNIGKTSFKSIFWIITGILAALLIIVSIRFKTKVAQAREAKSNFSGLEIEFDEYKKRSREKEQVLARQLQDEINKTL